MSWLQRLLGLKSLVYNPQYELNTVLAKVRTEQSYYSKITQKAPATQLLTKKVLKKFDLFCKENYDSSIEKIIGN